MALSYRIEGDGEPLLLLHGMGVTFTIWQNLVPLLRSHYKLILVELPGHGKSPLPDYRLPYYSECARQLEILRCELGIERWNILAYSMGAWAAQAYISRYPQFVSQAFVLCPAELNRRWAYSLKSIVRMDRTIPGLANWLLDGWRLEGLVMLLGFNGKKHPYAALWTREIHDQPVQVIKQLLRDLPGAGRAPLELPPGMQAHFIWGKQDAIVQRPKACRDCDAFIKGSHSAPMLSADEIARVILSSN